MENHHFEWVNQLFLWPFSIAFCMFTKGYMMFLRFFFQVQPLTLEGAQAVPLQLDCLVRMGKGRTRLRLMSCNGQWNFH